MGHGNSVGLFDNGITPFVIDCGTRDTDKESNFFNLIMTSLRKHSTRDLVISHYHFDHYSLINKFPFNFFDNIYVPALPPQSRSANVIYQFLSVATVLAFRNYSLTPIITKYGKRICPLVKGDLFNAMNREWEVLWPDYEVVDRINRRKINRIQSEIEKIVEELDPNDREAFEKTYGTLTRAFSKKEKREEQILLPNISLEKETDDRFNEPLRKIEGGFKTLANSVSLVIRDSFADFLFLISSLDVFENQFKTFALMHACMS